MEVGGALRRGVGQQVSAGTRILCSCMHEPVVRIMVLQIKKKKIKFIHGS